MPAAQQRDDQAGHHGVLADDGLADLGAQRAERVAGGVARRHRFASPVGLLAPVGRASLAGFASSVEFGSQVRFASLVGFVSRVAFESRIGTAVRMGFGCRAGFAARSGGRRCRAGLVFPVGAVPFSGRAPGGGH
ncbi:hypothetical protein Sru01_03640 [Sphaerisporangium rufum]|uniref:Uncharacterized protein n=1 Tax=Sphaerisporangium rufum TaxID=1381558 RepID=A0A919R1T7_9ACTN|nr:hypothetical protein Sru01_03640 [Sphaerisporangium rufum]